MNFRNGLFTFFLVTVAFCRENDGVKVLEELCDSLLQSPKVAKVERLAVLPLSENKASDDPNRGLAVAEQVIVLLSRQNSFTLVDRTDFQKMLQEIELSQTDLVDQSTAMQAGKLMAADAVLMGSIAELFGTNRITAKIVNTETGELLAGASVTVSPADLDNITKELLSERVQVSSSVFRSLLVPGWGQFYSNKPVRGSVSLAAAMGVLGYLGYACFATASAQSYLDAHKESSNGTEWVGRWDEYTEKLHTLENDHEKAYDRAVVAGVITGAVWALNLVDATVAGVQSKRKFEPYFAADLNGNTSAGMVMRW